MKFFNKGVSNDQKVRTDLGCGNKKRPATIGVDFIRC